MNIIQNRMKAMLLNAFTQSYFAYKCFKIYQQLEIDTQAHAMCLWACGYLFILFHLCWVVGLEIRVHQERKNVLFVLFC